MTIVGITAFAIVSLVLWVIYKMREGFIQIETDMNEGHHL